MEPDIKKILVPIDFSDYSKSALKYTVNFAKYFKAEIHLIYVIEPVIYPPDFSMGQIAIPAIDLDMDKRSQEELQKLSKKEIPPETKVQIFVKTGKPYIEIIETAREQNIDLIIIATHGHTGVEHILFGSTAEKVVRKAPCPVLTLREPVKGFGFEDEFNSQRSSSNTK